MTDTCEILIGTKLELGLDRSNIDSVVIWDPSIKCNVEIGVEDSFNCDPDGALWFLPKELLSDFKDFYCQYFSDNKKEFNFTNGPYAESFAVYDGGDNYLIIFLDPECGSGIFEDVVTQFSEIYDIDEMYGEDCHICSKLSYDVSDEELIYLPEIFKKAVAVLAEVDINGHSSA